MYAKCHVFDVLSSYNLYIERNIRSFQMKSVVLKTNKGPLFHQDWNCEYFEWISLKRRTKYGILFEKYTAALHTLSAPSIVLLIGLLCSHNILFISMALIFVLYLNVEIQW